MTTPTLRQLIKAELRQAYAKAGRKGGRSTSPAKLAAVTANIAKARQARSEKAQARRERLQATAQFPTNP